MAVDLATAKLDGATRVATVLRSQYATQLAAVADSGLHLPAPVDDAYYLERNEEAVEENRTNFPVCLFLIPGPTIEQVWTMRGATHSRVTVRWGLTLVVTLLDAPDGDFQIFGASAMPDGLLNWRAERYLGALKATIEKHARDGSAVAMLEWGGDSIEADHRTEGAPAAASCRVDLTITSDVLAPVPDYDTI